MPDEVTDTVLNEEVARRIFARRDLLMKEQREVSAQQAKLAMRAREIDRELAECRAAARFFGLHSEPPADDGEIAELQERIRNYRLRVRVGQSRGDDQEIEPLFTRIAALERRLRDLMARKDLEAPQGALHIIHPQQVATQDVPTTLKPTTTVVKIPKIRDIVLDQLQLAGDSGQKASSIQQYIEATYHVQLHGKTVGMTLYRLSAEKRVHRKGQVWFFGPQDGYALPVNPKNPGAVTPGPVNSDG